MADTPRAGRSARRVIVRYRTKPERADENQALIGAVFAALDRQAPDGLEYASFRLDDGLSFLHVATIGTDDGTNPLDGIEAFAAFSRDIAERCEAPPTVHTATLVGSYRGSGTHNGPTPTRSPQEGEP